VSGLDLHAEAHRLKAELGYGARRIAKELGITRHAATQLRARPRPPPGAAAAPAAAAPVAGVAGAARQVAEPAGPVADRVAGHLAALVGDSPAGGRRLVIDLDRFPGLAEDLALLQETGASAADVVNFAVEKLASVYRNARARGCLGRGQRFAVLSMRIRPGGVSRQARDGGEPGGPDGRHRPGRGLRELSGWLRPAALVRRAA
jgi:hypothetical protein